MKTRTITLTSIKPAGKLTSQCDLMVTMVTVKIDQENTFLAHHRVAIIHNELSFE